MSQTGRRTFKDYGYIRKPFRKFELSQAVAEAMRNISGQSLPRA